MKNDGTREIAGYDDFTDITNFLYGVKGADGFKDLPDIDKTIITLFSYIYLAMSMRMYPVNISVNDVSMLIGRLRHENDLFGELEKLADYSQDKIERTAADEETVKQMHELVLDYYNGVSGVWKKCVTQTKTALGVLGYDLISYISYCQFRDGCSICPFASACTKPGKRSK